MKKTIYLVLALLVLGGIAYALTQTSLLKGNYPGGEAPLRSDSDVTNMTEAQLGDIKRNGLELVATVALDTDGDKLPDDLEAKLGTSWTLADTDGDGIDDGQELDRANTYITDPLKADTDGGGVDDGTELKTNQTNPIDPADDLAKDQAAFDFIIQDLDYTASTGVIKAYVCVTGTVDPAWGDVSLYVDATNSSGTSYLTNKEYIVSAAGLVSDDCVTVDTGASVDTTLITEPKMDIFLKIDSKNELTEIEEGNNDYKELVETGVTPANQDPVPAEEVDLTIQGLDYTASTGVIKAYVCVDGTVDAAWGDVSLYVDAIDSNGDMYLTGTDNEHSVSATDLTSDGCVTVDTGAIVDTTLIDEVAMDIILNIDYTSEITETNEQNNSYTERVETRAANSPDDKTVDLTIKDLDYTSSTGAIRAYVCVEGTVDAAWGDVSLSVSAINSTGDEYLTSNDYTVAATDLTSDGCVTVDTGAAVDTALITEATMEITLYIDYKSEITETNEQNNTYYEQAKPVVQTEVTSTYACTEVNIDPDAYTYTVDDGTETVDLDITVKVAEKTVSFWNKLGHYLSFLTWGTDWLKASSFIAALDKETTYYSGTLVVHVEASGQGTLTDDKDISGTTLEIPVFWTSEDTILEHTVTYSNGNSGDIITAYIKQEVDCKDELTLAAPAEEGSYACTDLDIFPDSWDVTTDGTSMELEVKSTSDGEDWKGNLVVTTDGTGTLSDYEGGSGSSLDFDTGGLDYITYLTYSDAVAGETITASIEGEEQSCTDTLVISETTTTTTTTTTTDTTTDDDTDDTTTTTTTTTTTDDTDDGAVDENSDLDEILVSSAKEINCEEPFTDVDEGDWEWAYVVLMNCGDIVSGRDSDSFVPDGNITKAEVIKVLMLLSGHEKTDGDSLDLDFQDANIENHWSRDYLAIAQEERVIRYEEGAFFYPDAYANRGQVMLWMARTAGWTLWGWDEDDIFCSDLTKESPYAYAVIIGNLTLVKETWAGETWDEGYVRDSWTESYSDEYTPLFEGDNGYCRATDYLARSEAMALALRFYLALQTDLQ